jgi:hypothetical protein
MCVEDTRSQGPGSMTMARCIHAIRLGGLAIWLSAAACGSLAAQTTEPTTKYRGACDGSAAVALDSNFFAVADDDHNVLRVYRIGHPDSDPSLNVDQFLEAPKKKKKPGFKEADIEGAARIGDRIYWIGSHGRDSDGESEPTRSRFFATRIRPDPAGPRLEPIGAQAHKTLREDMFADPKLADLMLADACAPGEKVGPTPESENGFNIEGLAEAPAGGLLIGFRNPRPNKQAIVITLDNPEKVIDAGQKPVFGASMRLDLGGRGIRSIERIDNRYLIIAGPHGKAGKSDIKPPFALFTWGGVQASVPQMVPGITFPNDFTPEALFAIPDTAKIMVLSDDGDLDCKDKDEAQRTFRGMILPLPK